MQINTAMILLFSQDLEFKIFAILKRNANTQLCHVFKKSLLIFSVLMPDFWGFGCLNNMCSSKSSNHLAVNLP